MRHDLPSPDQILEELADNAAIQIDRLAPVAFDGALRELTHYHRFLLDLNASRTPNGAPYSYAEVPGSAWRAPHLDWIQQYRRLFERAADRIPDDDHFLTKLAYVPGSLLPGPGDPELPPGVVQVIVDLGPMLMHRLEAWVTKRTTVEPGADEAAAPRLLLAGSDAKAYANVLTRVVGAWETLLQRGPFLYAWEEGHDKPDVERWAAYRASWPFLWQHLQNTAYCLAVAVWNEDETGAVLFRDAFVRWPTTLRHEFEDPADLQHRRLLFPDILKLDWADATARAAPLLYKHMPAPTPNQLFNSVLRGAHDDAVVLTAALLLFWTINEKQVSDIGGRTAAALLRRELTDKDDGPRQGGGAPALGSLLLDILRLELAGERRSEGTYAADLDRFVRVLDNMTERRVVPGRVFTPSTLHGREELLLANVAILAAAMSEEGETGPRERLAELARDEKLLPEGDRSLRNILHELRRYSTTLEQSWPQVRRGFEILKPGADAQRATEALGATVSSVEAAIEGERRERLRARPVDTEKLERLRAAMETAILTAPAEVLFFRKVPVEAVAARGEGEFFDVTFSDIAKAQLVEPPMEEPISNFEEFFVHRVQVGAGRYVWDTFCSRERQVVNVAAAAEEEAFWREMAELARKVGPEPLLVVSQQAEGRILRQFTHRDATDAPNLKIERKPRDETGGFYIATVEEVDVYGGDFPPGTAWLFSARALGAVRYSALDEEGRYLTLSFEIGEDLKGTLRARFIQNAVWGDTPVFELHTPDPDDIDEH